MLVLVWQYQVLPLPVFDPSNMVKFLNEQGKGGWELVQVVERTTSSSAQRAPHKRISQALGYKRE